MTRAARVQRTEQEVLLPPGADRPAPPGRPRRRRGAAARIAPLLAALLAAGGARAQGGPDDPQPLLCVGPARARYLFFEKGLVPPIRVMRQASALAGAEAIDIQLCWFRGDLVYDVTLLGRDGPVTHRLMSAGTGAPLGGRPKP